jgi:hypothetical protein
MNRASVSRQLAGLVAVALLAAVATACNDVDDPGQAESVVLVTSVSTAGLSVASATDTTATIGYTLNPRNPGATTFYHDITLTSYTVEFAPAPPAPMSGVLSTAFCQAGGSCSVDLVLVPNGSKPGFGTTTIATVDVDGRDLNGNPITFSATIPLTFTP